jgi:hypothetical protein
MAATSVEEAREFYGRARDVPNRPAHILEMAKRQLAQLDSGRTS